MPFYSQHWRDVQDDNHIWDHWLTSILQEVRIHSTAFDFPHQSHDKHYFCQRNTTILNVTNLKQSSSKTCATSHHWTEYLGHFSKTHLLAAVYVTLVKQIPWLHSGTGVYFITTVFAWNTIFFFRKFHLVVIQSLTIRLKQFFTYALTTKLGVMCQISWQSIH